MRRGRDRRNDRPRRRRKAKGHSIVKAREVRNTITVSSAIAATTIPRSGLLHMLDAHGDAASTPTGQTTTLRHIIGDPIIRRLLLWAAGRESRGSRPVPVFVT